MMACCGLKRRKQKDSTRKSFSLINNECFLKLSTVISPTELDPVVSDLVKELFPGSSNVRLHFDESWPLYGASNLVEGPSSHAVKCFTNGYLKTVAQKRELSILRGSSLQESDVKELLGDAAGNSFGIIIPVGADNSNGATRFLITFFSNSLSPEDKESLRLLEKHLCAVCQRLERLASCAPSVNPLSPSHVAVCCPTVSSLKTSSKHFDYVAKNAETTVESDSANIRMCEQHPILALCANLFDSESEQLQLKVLKYLTTHTGCETGLLLLVAQDRSRVFCQVVGDVILEQEIHIAAHGNFFATVIRDKRSYVLSDIPEAQLADIHSIVGDALTIKSLLCVPVRTRSTGQVVALACLINKQNAANFTDKDEATIRECFAYTTSVLTSTIAFETERMLKNQTQSLLQVAQNIFRKLDDLTVLLREIMAEARNLTQAERCSVFLLDKQTNELVAKVFDGLPTTTSTKKEVIRKTLVLEDGTEIEQPVEIRIPANHGIAGHVVTSGELLNIKDAYSHPLFYSKVDEDTGFRTRNILCFPIEDESGCIVGVAQLCNKINAAHFTTFDEDIARAFSVYCCISINHSLMYKKVQDAQHRNQLATELMTYHMQVAELAVDQLMAEEIRPVLSFDPNFDSFASVPRIIPEDETTRAVLAMFEDLGLIKHWRINLSTLVRFILICRRGYRDPPYHNWSHAFSVGHFTYLCLKNLNLEKHLTPLEFFSFLPASLCHDIDHRGTNNSFENDSGSPLSGLYSSEGSVLERHHFSQTVCILNKQGCNIFENLAENEYKKVLDIIRDIILATDLAHHFKIKKEIEAMVNGKYDPTDVHQRYLLLCLLMTASDLSDQTKKWKNTRQVAQLIYQEFFSLGDREKLMGRQPAEGMDRDKADIPQLQVNFLNIIAGPVYKAMKKLWPEKCNVLTDQIDRNISNWEIIRDKINKGDSAQNDETIFVNKMVPDDEVALT